MSDILSLLTEYGLWVLTAAVIWTMLALVILIHEIGHAAAAKMLGVPCTMITIGLPALFTFKVRGLPISIGLIPLIGSARIDDTQKHWLTKLTVAIAGPIVSFLTACISYLAVGIETFGNVLANGFWIWEIVKAFWYDTDLPTPDPMVFAGNLVLKGILIFANVNLTLSVLNMLPVPILDGGRVMFAMIEGLTGKWILKYQPALIGISFWILMIWLILR